MKNDYTENTSSRPQNVEGEDVIEGRNSVISLIKSGRSINRILIKNEADGSLKQIEALAAERKIVLSRVDRRRLDSLSSEGNHQGVIAFAAAKDYDSIEDILELARKREEAPFILFCDGIEDPHNLGAIIRTANAVGVHGVVIPKRRSVGLTSAVYRASAGALSEMLVARVTNISSEMEKLKREGMWFYSCDMKGDKAYYEADYRGSIGLIAGGEDSGVGELVGKKCDFSVYIPMREETNSLNASVAAGIIMCEAARQRKA